MAAKDGLVKVKGPSLGSQSISSQIIVTNGTVITNGATVAVISNGTIVAQ